METYFYWCGIVANVIVIGLALAYTTWRFGLADDDDNEFVFHVVSWDDTRE